ncbi:MAG: aminodeoxychorismate lyase [Pseudomonadota bacterium]
MTTTTFPITFVDDKPVSQVPAQDRGLAYGDGVFETILVSNADMPFWSYHHGRLLKGLHGLKINLESQRLRAAIDKALAVIKDLPEQYYILKCIVTRGTGGRAYQFSRGTPTLVCHIFPYEMDTLKHNGVSVHLCQETLAEGISWAGLKTLNQLPYVLAAQERLNTPFDEGLLMSLNGYIIEATARNIFYSKDEVLFTPQLNLCGVAGVMRHYIIEKVAPQLKIDVREQRFTVDDLLAGDEVFLCNSVSGIWPVVQLDQHHWPIGPITRSIQAMCHANFL